MKKKPILPWLVIAALLLTLFSSAQTPQAFNYQAVVRNSDGQVAANQTVNFRITIRQGSVTGNIVYKEADLDTTNEFGLSTFAIGNGTPIAGNFSLINWSLGSYYLQVELDATGGSNFTDMGTQQLLSVPYALYAKTSGNGGGSGHTGPTGPTGVVALPFWEMEINIRNPFRTIVLEENSHIGLHILKKRLELGNTQKNVATLLGVKKETLWHWENEKKVPRQIYSAKIIKFLGYNPYVFKTGTIGEQVRTYRLLHCYTLQKFADLMGVHECTIVDWQAGRVHPSKEHMKKLKKLFIA